MTSSEALALLDSSELVANAAAVQTALDRLADEISTQLADTFPLVLTVMGGAVIFAGQILPRLRFPLQCDYLHITRYMDSTQGGEVRWVAQPRQPVAGRVVLVLDDVLDEGVTLAHVRQYLLEAGAKACYIAVLCDKDLGKVKPIRADFAGLILPNRYLFGCGMDVHGLWRNLPEIRVLPNA